MSTRALSVTLIIILLVGIVFLWGGKTVSHTAPGATPDPRVRMDTSVTHTMPDGSEMHTMPDGSMMSH